MIKITGNLGTLNQGDSIIITIELPITDIINPGSYLITNEARAFTDDIEASDRCTSNLDVVKLRGEKCCCCGHKIILLGILE
jgi:hypothetical protein